MKERTFCTDENGKEIFVGDMVRVSLNGHPRISEKPFFGVVPPPFEARVLSNRFGINGFMVKYGRGFLHWENDGEPCYGVQALPA